MPAHMPSALALFWKLIYYHYQVKHRDESPKDKKPVKWPREQSQPEIQLGTLAAIKCVFILRPTVEDKVAKTVAIQDWN